MRVTPARAVLAAVATVGVFAAASNAASTGVTGLSADRSPTNEAPVLRWKRLAGVAGYRVVRDGRVLGRVTTTSFTDDGVRTSGFHTYVVRGVKPDGTLLGGDRVNVIVDVLAPKSMTDRPSADSLTSTAQISWNPIADRGLAGIRQYNIRRDGVWIGSVAGDKLSFVDNDAPEGTHEYVVRAEDLAGNRAEEFSPAATVTVDRTAPGTPAGLTLTRSGRDVQLQWDVAADGSGIGGYRVLRNGEQIAATDVPHLLDSPAAGDYSYRVVAVDKAGNASEPSAAAPVSIQSTVTRAAGDTTGRIAMQTNLQMWGARVPDAATAVELAKRHDLITGVPGQLAAFIPQMRAANPNLRLFAYTNGMFSQSSQGGMFPESWYMRDASGNKLQSTGWGNYLMDPRATDPFTLAGTTYDGWTDWVRRQCKQALDRYDFDGCFLDMLGAAPLSRGYLRGREAIDRATGKPFEPSAYIALTGSVGRAVEAYVGKSAIGNGLGGSGSFYSVPTRNLLGATGISLAEVWMRSPGSSPSSFPTVDRWKREVQMLIDANRAGHSVEATMKVWTGATDAQLHAWRLYGQASFLIGNSGSSWFEFTSSRSTFAWHDEGALDGLDLGAAIDTHESVDGYLRDGVYQRRFAGGIALVNPGDRPVAVKLDATYRTPTGGEVSSLTLEPHSGQVLLAR